MGTPTLRHLAFAGASALALLFSAHSASAQTPNSNLTPDQISAKRSELERQKAAIQAEIDSLDRSSAGPPTTAAPAAAQPSGATVSQVTVTAAAATLTQHPTGQAVATVSRDLFKDQPDVNIADVLDLVPGVSVIQGNGPRDVSVSIRGSNDRQSYAVRNVQLFEDGFPVTQPDGTGRMDLTDPHAYGAIDVVEGPSSALYGNYATGGAINFHTRAGGDIDGVEVGADFGSYGYYNDYATIGGAGDRYAYSAFISNVRADGSTSNSAYDTVTENILATYQVTPQDRVTFKLINNDLDADLSVRLSLNQFKQNPYQQACAALQAVGCGAVSLYANGFNGAKVTDSAQEADLGRHDRRTILGARWEHDLDAQTTWRTTFDFDNRDINQPTSSTSSRGTYPSFDVISDVTHHGQLFGMTSTSLVGAFFNYEDINSYTYNVVPGSDPQLGGNLGGLVDSVFGHQLDAGFRGREELQLTPQLTAVVGLGVEYTELKALEANYTYSAVTSPSQSDISAYRTFVNAAPEASLQYKPQSDLTLHARLGTGYGTPQATNLFITPQGTFGNNTQLQPQTNVGLDVGAEWAPSATLHLFVTGFYEWFTDELVTQSAGVNLQSYTFNAPHSEHRGVEVGFDWRPLPAILPGARLYASYLFDDQLYTSYVERLTSGSVSKTFNRDGNAIPGVTPSFGDVRLIYDQPSGALQGVGGFIEAVARDGYYLDNANLLKAPGYVLLNGELHYDPPPGPGAISRLRFYVDVQNLLDQTYVGTASNITDSLNGAGVENGAATLANTTGSIYAGTPRSVFGGVRVKF
jgi:iron complex outermembrane receptor protein